MQPSSNIAALRILGFCTLFLLSACQQKSESSFAERAPAPPPEQSESNAKLDQAPGVKAKTEQFADAASNGDIFSSAAAVPGAIDSLKKFIRNAEMRFRVKNTADATLRIEDIALRNGGFVLNSNLNSQIDLQQTTPISRDSSLETTRYTIHSQLVIRVPYRMLDTTLRSIGRLSDFLDMRHVNAEDISLQMLEQELTRLREGIYRQDLEQAEENKNSPKADRARDSRAATDQAKIETLKLEDAIRFSTIRVDIYQLPQIRQAMVANTKVAAPQQPFATRMGDALRAGAEILLVLFFGIVHLWGLILLVVLGYFSWKWLRNKRVFLNPKAQRSA